MKRVIVSLLLAFSIAIADVHLVTETVISTPKDTIIIAELCINGYLWVTTLIETGRPMTQAYEMDKYERVVPVKCIPQ